MATNQQESDAVGLCPGCRHVQKIDTRRGSRFYRCRLASSDPRFARYPRLPVTDCSGFERCADEFDEASGHDE
ncbi:MAG: hypothetical protein JSV80_12270 [Acidobacteriota bacterium]|nr:MAG: hypothetical protein JSV80_12270 [Acidobacteriota bacterium]